MTDDRNLTAHTYVEAIAEKIYHKLPAHWVVMNKLLGEITARIQQD